MADFRGEAISAHPFFLLHHTPLAFELNLQQNMSVHKEKTGARKLFASRKLAKFKFAMEKQSWGTHNRIEISKLGYPSRGGPSYNKLEIKNTKQ